MHLSDASFSSQNFQGYTGVTLHINHSVSSVSTGVITGLLFSKNAN